MEPADDGRLDDLANDKYLDTKYVAVCDPRGVGLGSSGVSGARTRSLLDERGTRAPAQTLMGE
jgi:hypothetical protein